MIERNDPPAAAESDAVTYERDPDEPPSRSVIRAVASVNGTDPMEMQPLYDAIDPDALDRVFESAPDRPRPLTDGLVSFRFSDCHVTVYADGRTVVEPDE